MVSTDHQHSLSQESMNEDRSLQARTYPEGTRGSWSIGIYSGDSPLRLSSPAGIQNPILSYKDVSDVRANFVADPFMIIEEGLWYMFFEIMNEDTHNGEIGLAISNDGFRWRYVQSVLRESFHLSYPNVFKWEDDYYLIPESLSQNSVSLYRADSFPTRWTSLGTLISGEHADPSIFYFNSIWWMFASSRRSDKLHLYYSENLMGPWQEHVCNPIRNGDACISRPGGRVTKWGSKLIRYTQDCKMRYGYQVRAFEITDLTIATYSEKEAEVNPVIFPTNQEWNSRGMHHVDPHLTAEGIWIACVDGY
jgi:hypothetical protein